MRRLTRPPRPSWVSQGAFFLAALALAGPAAGAQGPDTTARGQEALVTLGEASTEIRFPEPVRYAVVLREPGKARMVFTRGDVLFHSGDPSRSWTVERVEAQALILREGPRGRPLSLPPGSPIPGFPGHRFTGTVLLDQVHYRYKAVERLTHPDPLLVALEGSRATLEVEVLRPSRPSPAVPPEGRSASSPQSVPSPRATLDGEVLGKVRVREIAPGLYDVNAADVQAALEDTGRVLAEVWPAVQPTLSLQAGLQYRITSAASDGVLTAQGYTVTAPKLAERFGIQAGDTILSVNGQPVDGFASLYGIYRTVQGDPSLRTVQVELERRGTRLTKTYRIR
ncbi:MAG: PDZ domain-containing protein [Candidatus Methylomirabilales bacterium]